MLCRQRKSTEYAKPSEKCSRPNRCG
jgi:hypothetical protein